jgi:hypothetical protein
MTVIAHHALVTAIPFVVPMLVVVIGVAVLSIRDRRQRRRGGGQSA